MKEERRLTSFADLDRREFASARDIINPLVAYDVINHAWEKGQPYMADPDKQSPSSLKSIDLDEKTKAVVRQIEVFDPAYPSAQIAVLKGDSTQIWHITREGFIKESGVKGELQRQNVMLWFEESVTRRTTYELLEETGVDLNRFARYGYAGITDIGEVENLSEVILALAQTTKKQGVSEISDLTYKFFTEEGFRFDLEEITSEMSPTDEIFTITGNNAFLVARLTDPLSGEPKHIAIYYYNLHDNGARGAELYFLDNDGLLQVARLRNQDQQSVDQTENLLLSRSRALLNPETEDTSYEPPQEAQDWEKEFIAHLLQIHAQRIIKAREIRDYVSTLGGGIAQRSEARGRIEYLVSLPDSDSTEVISLYSRYVKETKASIITMEYLYQLQGTDELRRHLLYLGILPADFESRFVVGEPVESQITPDEVKASHERNLRRLQKARRGEKDSEELFKALNREWPLMVSYKHSGEVAIQPTPDQLAAWLGDFQTTVDLAKTARQAELAAKPVRYEGSTTPRPRKKKKK